MAAILIYVYDVVRPTPASPSTLELTPSDLLLPPLLTNRLPWSRGYFETIDHSELEDSDVLPAHSFRDSRGRFLDENSRELPGPVDPVGEWGLHSYRTIDDAVADALGLPRAPD